MTKDASPENSSVGGTSLAVGDAAALNVELQTRAFSKQPGSGEDYYQKLGVTPSINAAGTYTCCSYSTSFRMPKRSGTWKLSRIGARQAM